MKKTVILLLTLALLAACLAGCAKNEEQQFFDQVEELTSLVETNLPLIELIQGYEVSYMQENNYTDDSNGSEIAAAALTIYQYGLEEAGKQGTKTEHATINKIDERSARIDELAKLIGNSEYGKQNAAELKEAAVGLGITYKSMTGLLYEPYGPASSFKTDFNGIKTLANHYIEVVNNRLNEQKGT